MDSIVVAVVLCQIHMQAVDEYILDDQPINSEQYQIVLLIFINCHSFKTGAVFS